MVSASLDAALGLIGRGAVATVVGRLVPGVVVVDVDVEGVAGWAIAEHVCAWADRVGCWSLLRPSGGADGRCHIFVTGADLTELTGFVAALRDSYGVSASRIDVRYEVRPLSAPHRNGVDTAPLGDLDRAFAGLVSAAVAAAETGDPAPVPVDERTDVALMPVRRRARRDLPPEWAAYLVTGVAPAFREGADASRSSVEHVATVRMVQAGWTPPQAWAAIQAAHPEAMQRARASYRRWVRTAWNTAVHRDDAYQPAPRPAESVAAAVLSARCALLDLAWTLPPRARPALLTVGHAVLDRMERTNTLRVPVPERDLLLDTGITDRRTIRAQLRRLHGSVGRLHTDTFTPTVPSSSYEFEIAPTHAGVFDIDPPSFHTPYAEISAQALTGPRHTWTTLRHLPDTPTSTAELSRLCLLTDSPTSNPTPGQLRSLVRGLRVLQREGLAECTPDGCWYRTDAPLSRELLLRDRPQRDLTRETVEAERAAWRARGSGWSTARAAALKAEQVRRHQWWDGLPADERRQRAREWSAKYAGLSVQEQERVKTDLAHRDSLRGVDPVQRRATWLAGLTQDELVHRSQDRAAWFAGLPDPLKTVYASMWARDRARTGMPRLAITTVRRQ